MDQPSAHLALDITADAVRGLLGILHRSTTRSTLEVLAIERAPCPAMQQVGIRLWDIEGLRRGLVNTLRAAHRHCTQRGTRLLSVGLTAPGADFCLLGSDGMLLSPPRAGPDPRHDAGFMALNSRIAPEQRFAITGVAPARDTTLAQLAGLEFDAPGSLRRASTLTFLPDLFHELLSGTRVCELSVASASELLDLDRRDWSANLLASAAAAPSQVRALTPPCTPIGHLVRDLGGRAGVDHPVEVVIPPSTPLAAAAAGLVLAEKSPAFLLVGDENAVALERPRGGQARSAGAFRAGVSNRLASDGCVLVTKHTAGLEILGALRRDLRSRGRAHTIPQVAGLASSAGPSPLPVDLGDPALLQQRRGDADTIFARIDDQFRRRGGPVAIDPAAAIRACLEGFAQSVAQSLRAVEEATGERITDLVVGGNGSGGARGAGAAALVQEPFVLGLLANAASCRVHAGPMEPTLIGNVLCQARGLGLVPHRDDATGILRRMTTVRTYEPTAIC